MTIDDGSDKPEGFVSSDGELEVREVNGERCYHETPLGQHMRWMRQAPDLYTKYQEVLDSNMRFRQQIADLMIVSIPVAKAEWSPRESDLQRLREVLERYT